jgi:drug/metabolite transporter (DMT)-like permease
VTLHPSGSPLCGHRPLGRGLVAVGFLQRRRQPQGVRAWSWLTLIGLVNVTLAFAAMFAGVAGLATGTAAVLANAQPLLILDLALLDVAAWRVRPRRLG